MRPWESLQGWVQTKGLDWSMGMGGWLVWAGQPVMLLAKSW